MAKERYVSYRGCKFKVLKELDDGTAILENCAVKLKKEPIRVKEEHISKWEDIEDYRRKERWN